MVNKRELLGMALALGLGRVASAQSDDTFRIGMLAPMTGPFASTGKQMEAAVRLYIAQNGDRIGKRKIELILRDDGGQPETTKRLAQELVVNQKVHVLTGFGLTPLALVVAPLATQAKVPMVNMLAATSSVIDASPYMVRVSMTLPQVTLGIADWAPQNGIQKVVTLVSDYGPGHDAERTFRDRFLFNGGKVLESIRVPVRNPDFAPFLQRVRDLSPDAVFVFVPSGAGTQLMKQFNDRGLTKAGIKIIGTGEIVDDDLIGEMGDEVLGVVTSYPYSTAHSSPKNKKFVADFRQLNHNLRPNAVAVFAYDGMHVIYEALRKTGGKSDGDSLLAAMKGMIFESPRGQIYIDASTRDIVQSIYIRRVERTAGELYSVEFQEIKDVRDPPRAR